MASKRRAANGVALAFPFAALAASALLACLSSQSGTLPGPGGADSSIPGPDTGGPASDSGPPSADASSKCAPANVKGYVPRWTPPKSPQSACAQAELTSYGACLDSNDPSSPACASWKSGGTDGSTGTTCQVCVADSKASDPAWGPLVDVGTNGSDRQLNVSGCLAIVLHDTGSGCAGSYQALQECESAACADNCQGASSADLGKCISEADSVGCSNYLGPAACVYDAGTAAACFGAAQTTFGQKFAAVAGVFCLRTDGGP